MSSDYGANWTILNMTETTYGMVCSSDGRYLYRFHKYNRVDISYDFGASFTSVTPSALSSGTPVFGDCSTTGQHVMFYTTTGYFFISRDYGQTWTRRSEDTSFSVGSIAPDGSAVACCRYGNYAQTAKFYSNSLSNEANWGIRNFTSIDMGLNGGNYYTVFTVGDRYVYRAANLGSTLNSGDNGSTAICLGAACSNNGLYQYSARQGLTIGKSSNSGSTWVNTTSPSRNWYEISCDSTGQYVVATSSYGVAHSTNYGVSWTEFVLSGIGYTRPFVCR